MEPASYPASYTFLIRQWRVLKRKILWRAKEVALMFSVKQVFLKFCNIHRKIPVLESLFNKVAGLQRVTLSKKETLVQMFSYEFLKILRHVFLSTPPGDCFCKSTGFLENVANSYYYCF